MPRTAPAPLIRLTLATLLAAGTPASAAADTLVLVGGRTLQGTVLQEDERGVVFESHRHGARMRQSVPAARIASVTRTVREGVAVAVVPLVGPVGVGMGGDAATSAGLAEGLRLAAEQEAERIVLVVDSPGGRLDEMEKMLGLLEDPTLPPVTAYVREALSAAAVLALSCDDLVVAPGARIGAAVPLKLGPDGTPQNIEAKYRSGYVASLRRVAERAGRDPQLLVAMADERAVLYVVDTGEGPRLTGMKTERVHKPAGEILTLTAHEAVRFGVARGRSTDVAGVLPSLGVRSWHSVGTRAWEGAARVNEAEGRAFERMARGFAATALHRELSPALADAAAAVAERERAIAEIKKQRVLVDAWLKDTLASLPVTAADRRRLGGRTNDRRAEAKRQHAVAAGELDAALETLEGEVAELRGSIRDAREMIEGVRG